MLQTFNIDMTRGRLLWNTHKVSDFKWIEYTLNRFMFRMIDEFLLILAKKAEKKPSIIGNIY